MNQNLINNGDFSPKSIAKCIQSSPDREERKQMARCIIGAFIEWVQEHSYTRLFEGKRRRAIKHIAWTLMRHGYVSPLLWAPLGPLSLHDFCSSAVYTDEPLFDELPF